MGGLGKEGGSYMYHYVNDKKFCSKMRGLGGRILQDTCHILKKDYDIGANFYLVGSGIHNLIMQNSNNSIDLDYNLEIVRCDDYNACRYLKESARKAFNKALSNVELRDCEDSHSALTSGGIQFLSGNQTEFFIDVCIVTKDVNGSYHRLIHEKSGWTISDRYYWNIAPNSEKIENKVKYIKERGKWLLVREQYLSIKNKYLKQNDHNHPSFICYIEAVNNVYNSRMYW